jgi:hypothetical protein
MEKTDIQKFALSPKGEYLPLEDFNWCEKTRTFSANVNNVNLNLSEIDFCNVKTGSDSTVTTGCYSTVTTGHSSTVKTGDSSTVTTGCYSTVKTGDSSTITTGYSSTVTTMDFSTVKTGSDSTVTTGWDSTVTAGHSSTVKTGSDSTVTTRWNSTVTTGSYSTVTTRWNSTVNCLGDNIVIVNRNVFEVITPKKGDVIQICPHGIEGHLVNGLYNGNPHIIADGILSKLVSQKGDVYKVINHGEDTISYLVKKDNVFSHGKTLQEARDSLIYKLSDKDTSKYSDYTLDTIVSHEDAIQMYMCITGACSSGTKYFVDMMQDKIKSEYSVSDLIQLTSGQYGNEKFKEFFK